MTNEWIQLLANVPTWARIVGTFLLIGVIGGAFKWSDFFTLKKSEKELDVKREEIRAASDRELGTSAFTELKALVDRQATEITGLKTQIDQMNSRFDEERAKNSALVDELRSTVSELTTYLAIVRTSWETKWPHEPFPIYPPVTTATSTTTVATAVVTTTPAPAPEATTTPTDTKKD